MKQMKAITPLLVAALLTALAAAATGQCLELEKLTPGSTGDFTGCAVAMSSDIAVVGAPNHPFSVGTGMPGPGAVYVYHSQGGTSWQLAATLTAPAGDDQPDDRFGAAVAIQGDRIVVGAAGDDEYLPDAGALYVFLRQGSSWTPEQKLLPFNSDNIDSLGESVSIWDDTIIAGAGEPPQGAALVYRRDSNWMPEAFLTPANAQALQFGTSVALYQNTALIGAPGSIMSGSVAAGSAHFFHRVGSLWTEQQEAINPTPANFDQFGHSVAIRGRWAVIGAPYDFTVATNTGASYIYRQDMSGVWQKTQDVFPSDGSLGGHLFGWSCALDGEKIVVGAPQAGILFDGAAYQFNVAATSWSEVSKYVAGDADGSDWFGFAVGVGTYALVGAYLDDEAGTDSGAAYIWELCP